MSLILEKRVIFWKDVSALEKKSIFIGIFTGEGFFSGDSSQRFFNKRDKISERGTFLIWRSIIRPPFYM